MKRTIRRTIPWLILTLLAACAPVLAAGPVDGEVTAMYWLSDTETLGYSMSSEDVGFRGELWLFKRFGASASMFSADLDGASIDYSDLDVKYRLFSPTENTFFALGVGLQRVDVGDDDTSGIRGVAEGRVAFTGLLYGYGRLAYAPNLDDVNDGMITVTDGKSTEYELGVMVKPMPFLQLFGGYRSDKIEFDLIDWETSGFVAGVGINF